jgi:hypothetical protein
MRVQEQAGLTLESTRGPVPMVIIERVEQPSPNEQGSGLRAQGSGLRGLSPEP